MSSRWLSTSDWTCDACRVESLDRARQLTASAQHITALTGAGISTDSGIPDFRGPKGVWTNNPGAEKTATLRHYLADPDIRRAAWRNRLDSPTWSAQPNAGHRSLVALERQGRLQAVVTQNIDELHQRAGSSPELVVELHGTMRFVVCWGCGERGPMERALERLRAGEDDPHCHSCGGILKSDTISFGQALDPLVLAAAEAAVVRCDLLIAIGSSLTVYPAASLVPLAKRIGAGVIIINAQPTPFDEMADAVLHAPISEVLPGLV
jgi:NAD-dependent deacetylase